jgi:hypothetical protein
MGLQLRRQRWLVESNRAELERRRCERTIEIVVSRSRRSNGTLHPFLFDCELEGCGLLLCTSRQPFLDGARELIALGFHPDALLVMRHAGSSIEALKGRLNVASRLTVDEHNGTRFAPWKAFPGSAPGLETERHDEAA